VKREEKAVKVNRAAGRSIAARAGLLPAVAVFTLLGGILAGTASATTRAEGAPRSELRPSPVAGSPERPEQTSQTTPADPACKDTPNISMQSIVRLVLDPDDATIGVGRRKAYSARLELEGTPGLDVTCWTRFAIKEPNGSCSSNACSATQPGDYTVSGTFPTWERRPSAKDTAHLRVVREQPASLRLRPNPAGIEAGGTVTYAVDGLDADGRPLPELGDLAGKAHFSIEGPVGSDGSCPNDGKTCTATTVGRYTVTATVTIADPDNPATVSGTADLHVIPGPLDKLTLSPNPATISAGEQQAFRADGSDAYDNPLGDLTGKARFSIEGPVGSDGSCPNGGNACTATRVGDYTATATVDLLERQVTGQARLHVEPGRLDKLTLSPPEATILAGTEQFYTAAGADAFGNPVDDASFKPVFSIGPDGSCTRDACTATKVGPHTVTATVDLGDGKVTGKATLHVEPGRLDKLAVSPPNATIAAGSRQRYTAAGADAFGNPLGDVTARTRFTVSGPDGSCTGNACTATRPGDHTVTGTVDLGDRKVTGTAVLRVGRVPARLELRPGIATIPLGGSQTYTVRVRAKDGSRLDDVTAKVRLSISPDGSCQGARCTPAAPGEHTVTAVLPGTNLSGTAKLRVVPRVVPKETLPSVASATTPAGRVVQVRGSTGSCSRAGTLTLHGVSNTPVVVAADRHGDFATSFTVPMSTFPKAYKLELTVDCKGQAQRAEGTLTVVNHAPVAVDDPVSTPKDTAVAVAVTGNDRDPDGDGDYPTLVFEQSLPTHGTTQVRPDGAVVYAPDPGFVGQDRFRYSNCDVLAPRDAAGRWKLACGTATVTVTVNPSVPPTSVPPTSVPPTSVPPTSVPPTSTRPDCQPRPGDVRSFRVDPGKGPSGAQLHVTGTADRRLAACPLGLLLGGSRLGPDLRVQPDGSISQRLPVPDGVKPGASMLRLAAPGGQVVAQAPFEVLPTAALKEALPWWRRGPVGLLVAAAAFAAGLLARAATRRWRRGRDDRRREREAVPQHLRAEPHARPVRTSLEQTTKGAPNVTVRLRAHHDAGTQALMEETA
jgi:Bacterial Ig domain